MQIDAWEYMLGTKPFIQHLKNFDSTHPGGFEEICEMFSVTRNKTGIS